MYVVIPFDKFNISSIFFGSKQANTMVSYCYFTNILYSTKYFSLSNIIFHIRLSCIRIKHVNDMMFVYFDPTSQIHKKYIDSISVIEKDILKSYSGVKDNVFIQENITSQIMKGSLKLHISNSLKYMYESFNNTNIDVLLRISGVWENEYSKIGLIYKFLLPTYQQTSIHNTLVVNQQNISV